MKAPLMNNAVTNLQNVLRQNTDIRNGKASILSNRDSYFIKLDKQTPEQFESMVKMAPVYILYPKIVDGFTGTVFAKPPNLTGVKSTGWDFLTNVDMLGNSMNKLSEKVVSQVFENGFCATFNDFSSEIDKPFIRFVPAEQFISFRTNSDKGYPQISQFIYSEKIEVDSTDDEFDVEIQKQFTVLDLTQKPGNKDSTLRYRIRVFSEDDNGHLRLKSEAFPTKQGKEFASIPMQLHGIEASNFTIKKSPLQDLSDMNISIMQRVVDQVYMLHWTALPTPYVTGVNEGDEPLTIGPTEAWTISEAEAKVGMLEFSGSSAKAHQDFIDNLKDVMAATGAQILKKEGVSRETATSVLVRTAAQTSLVSTLVKNVSEQLQHTLQNHLDWSNIQYDDDFGYRLNDDFIKVDMEPNSQIALVKSWLDGAISHRTMFTKMKEGEIIPTNKTFEEEIQDIAKNPPSFFAKDKDADLARQQAKIAEGMGLKIQKDKDGGEQPNKDYLNGSNLENENLANEQATEQAN